MRLKSTSIGLCLALAGCGQGASDSENSELQKQTGMFSGALAAKEYNVAVNCSHFDKDYFQFLSDRTDISDTNGDGIIISGMQNNGKFVLTIVDNGKTFSVGRLVNFTKGEMAAEGSGQLFEEGTAKAHDVEFTVTCR